MTASRATQNKDITWRHLLTQTSEWQGTMFGKEDRIDHNRVVGLAVAEAPKGTRRAAEEARHASTNTTTCA